MALSLSREKETADECITFLSCSFELSIENAEMYKEEEKETKNKKVVKMVLLNTYNFLYRWSLSFKCRIEYK